MYRVAMFTLVDYFTIRSMEDAINKFLRGAAIKEVRSITQTETEDSITITILYTKRQGGL